METLVLAAALLAADAEVRQSEAFALAGELGRFPHPSAIQQTLANEHLRWLRARKEVDSDVCPRIDDLIEEQYRVVSAYEALSTARSIAGDCVLWPRRRVRELRDGTIIEVYPHESSVREDMDRLRELIGDDDYFAGRLPAPVTCQRH